MATTAPLSSRPADGAPPVPRHAAEARDARHLDARARARRGRAPLRRPGSSRCSTPSGSARCRSRSRAAGRRPLVHTVRAVGAVTEAICAAEPGSGARRARAARQRLAARRGAGGDIVVVAGGIGLAPLRAVVYERRCAGAATSARSALLYGSRTPADLLYPKELERWRRASSQVDVTVDAADRGWAGKVGFVAKLVAGAASTRRRDRAFVCGPEIMMRFTARRRCSSAASRRSGSTSRWSATCNAASAAAATASSARR